SGGLARNQAFIAAEHARIGDADQSLVDGDSEAECHGIKWLSINCVTRPIKKTLLPANEKTPRASGCGPCSAHACPKGTPMPHCGSRTPGPCPPDAVRGAPSSAAPPGSVRHRATRFVHRSPG